MATEQWENVVEAQRSFFASGHTFDLGWRRKQLDALAAAIESRTDRLIGAVYRDLRKPPIQTFTSEVAIVLSELRLTMRKLDAWGGRRGVRLPLMVRPARGWVQAEPYGVALIVGPWNNPLGLVLHPLVSAVAAGNCAILKPSELAPASASVLTELIAATFDPRFVTVAEGDAATVRALIHGGVDYVFLTGSPATGRAVMAAAAEHLTPLTLELGGKSPCIVDRSAPLRSTARRIAWAKFFATGQTCVAPDFVIAEQSIRPHLVDAIVSYAKRFYGRDPKSSSDYSRIVNRAHTERLARMLDGKHVAYGGDVDPRTNYIAPTVLSLDSWTDPLMQEEIFGPLLPVLAYRTHEELFERVRALPTPLALYLFTRDRTVEQHLTRALRSGSVCVNGCMSQIMSLALPFGGLGASGFGSYHGKAGFDAFSRPRSFVRRAPRLEFVPAVYPPQGRWDMQVVRRWWRRFM